jgi:para-aminobenzoate synthetase component 1
MALVPLALRRDPLDAFRGIADEPGAAYVELPDPAHPMVVLSCRPVEELRVADDHPAPLDAVAAFVARAPAGGNDLPAVVDAGLIGCLAYEAGRPIAPRARRHASALPAALVRRYDPLVVFDRLRARWSVRWQGRPRPVPWLERLGAGPAASAALAPTTLAPAFTPATYRAAVARIQRYLAAGDVYQANLTVPFRTPFAASAATLFDALARRHPAAHAAYLDAGDFWVVMNSPELFLRRRGERIETRPIKGTRPRADDPVSDTQLAAELAADPKERAEHLMIVDLERNDLGRICRVGSVQVDGFAEILSLPTVHHLVSTVRGRVAAGTSLGAVLAATFPGGSITGAPKIRAMEVIAEIEPEARGVYTGAFGLFAPAGDLELGLPIRTAVVRAGTLTYRAGGGIVADSHPDRELAECWTKTDGLRRVLGAERAPSPLERCSSG